MTNIAAISKLLLMCQLAGLSLRPASAADFASTMGPKTVAPVLVACFASMGGRQLKPGARAHGVRAQAALAAFLLTVHAGCGAGNCRPTAPVADARLRPALDDGS